jgi:hypothetical protein
VLLLYYNLTILHSNYNGKCFFIDETWVYSDKFLLFTDASGVHGYGAVFEKSWFYGSWNEEWLSYNITVTQLYPIVLAVGLWRERLATHKFFPIFYCT